MQLDSSTTMFNDLPQKYAIDILDQNVQNTFCFTEQRALPPVSELAAVNGKHVSDMEDDQLPPLTPEQAAALGVGVGRASRIYARVVHKCNARPLDKRLNELPRLKSLSRTLKKQGPRILTLDEATQAQEYMNPIQRGWNFEKIQAQTDTFNLRKKEARKGEERYMKMDREKLQPLIFDCFQQHEYWEFGALQDKLKQPAGYLREVLADIAEYVKQGQYHGLYRLREEFRTEGTQDGSVSATVGGQVGPRRLASLQDDSVMEDEGGEADEEEMAHLGLHDV